MNERKINLSKKLIHQALIKYTALFNKSPSDKALELYAEVLAEKYEFKQVTWALSEHIKKGSPFFPSCGEIFNYLKVEEIEIDKAPAVASEIIKALRTYGPHAEKEMLANVSTEARLTLIALGHTADIRNSENVDTVRAQIERLARSVLKTNKASEKKDQLEKIGISLTGMKKLNFSEIQK
jgi:predicted  nucleic acid-binding Zn-ribbon protein